MAMSNIRVEITEKVCELNIKYMPEVNALVAPLVNNGYDIQISPVWAEWPKTGVDHYAVRIGKKSEHAT